MILLSEEEINKLIYPRGQGKRAVAKAQLKKVVEWVENRSVNELESHYTWFIKSGEWDAIRKEVE